MESQLHHPQDTGLHIGEGHGQVHDEGEQHHHKKSVLKKVKAKAKKIKDTLKHGLGHEHEHHPLQGDHGVDEEEEEGTDDEDMDDAEVHGGPYAIRSKDIPKEDIIGNLENPKHPKEDRYDAKMKDEDVHGPILRRQEEFRETHENKGGEQKHKGQQGHENIGGPTGVLEPYPPHFRGEMHNPPPAIEEDRAKDIDHEITGLSPNPSHFPERPPSAVETYPAKGGIDRVTGHGIGQYQAHKIGALAGIKEDPHAPKDPMASPNDSIYQSRVTGPTGPNNEGARVSPLVRSFEKMGVEDVPEATPTQGAWQLGAEGGTGGIKRDQGTEHSQYTGSHNQFAPEEEPTGFPSVSKDTELLPKNMDLRNPEDSPHDALTGKPGSYTEKISIATSAIADKAVAAKNVVASKLGYGGTEDDAPNKSWETAESKDTTKTTSSATELAQKAASTVAEKLVPVYEKVASAGSTIVAKVTGHANSGDAEAEHGGNTNATTDKGVSMKEYLAEKFKPGEEDKALSEVISGSLTRQKEKTEGTGEAKIMGKVTESEEVERKLGPIEDAKEDDDNGDSGETVGEGFSQAVVDRFKGAVNNWLGKGGEAQTPPGTTNDSADDGGAVVGGRGA